MGKSRTAKPAETRDDGHHERILRAAAALFLENGYEETSTADIARRARVSKRELYSNFADKRDILGAVIAQLQAEILSQANISWSSSDDIRKVLTQAGTRILEFISSERFGKLFRIVVAESFSDPETAQSFYRLGPILGLDDTAAFMRRQIKAGNLRNADALQAADDFLDLVLSSRHLTAVVLGQVPDGPPPLVQVKHAVDVFLHYYGAKTARKKSRRSIGPVSRDRKRVPRTGSASARSGS
jgi:AcrR family transcriptional regulator